MSVTYPPEILPPADGPAEVVVLADDGARRVIESIACKHAWTIGDNAWSRVKAGTKRHCPRCGVTETMFWAD